MNKESFLQTHLKTGPVTILKLEEEHFVLEVFEGEGSQAALQLEAGSLHEIKVILKTEPATDRELESAIEYIEDALMPVIATLPAHRILATSEAGILELGKIGGLPEKERQSLSIDLVEDLFRKIAEVSYGVPAARLGIPETRHFAAITLYVRELLHHGGYTQVHILV